MPASDIENAGNYEGETPETKEGATRFTRRRITIFLSVITTIFLSANWFVLATWNYFRGSAEIPAWEIIPPALSLAFIGAMFLGWRFTGLWLRILYRVTATWLGILNFAVFASCAAWIFSGIAAVLSLRIEPGIFAIAIPTAAVLAGIYGIVNAAWLRITRVTVRLPNLPAAWAGRSVALVTDMHLGNVRGAGFTRRVVARLTELQPAAVLIGGDMFDGVKADLDALLAPWKKMSAPHGIFYVTGNHEEFDERAEFIGAVRRAGIRVLDNQKMEIDGLQIVGIHDGETHDPAVFRALLRGAGLDRARASILLAHQPANLAIPAEEGISLQLSGHTHGGQIWPWHWLAARVHGKYVHGLHWFQRMQVLTSYGAGTWGVPMRAATKSEIVLIRLEPEKA